MGYSRRTRAGPLGLAGLAMLVLMVLSVAPAMAKYWFKGVSNDWPYGTKPRPNKQLADALSKYPNWSGTGANITLANDEKGSAILAELEDYAKNKVKDGDVFVFYYDGHGGHQTDSDKDEPTGDTAGDETIGTGTDWVTDDQIAGKLGLFSKKCTVVSIFDNCFSGGQIGGTKDADSNKNNDNLVVFASTSEKSSSQMLADPTWGTVFGVALQKNLKPCMNSKKWWEAAVKWGEENKLKGTSGEKLCWPKSGETFDANKHWQERPVLWHDAALDPCLATPELSSLSLLLATLPVALGLRRRRRRGSNAEGD